MPTDEMYALPARPDDGGPGCCACAQEMTEEMAGLHEAYQRLANLVKTIWAQQCAMSAKLDAILERLKE